MHAMNTMAYRTHYASILGKRPRRKSAKSRSGLTIIEVALASALLIIALVPIIKSLTTANVISSAIERKTQSLVLAQGKLDEIKARSIYNFGSAGAFAQTNLSLGNSYLCNVTDVAASADLRTITVSVGRDENGNGVLGSDEVDVTLASYVARRW